MVRRFIFLLVLFIAPVSQVLAHPHAFVECTFAFVMDKDGLVGFKQRWTLDEMTTVSVLDVVDTDRNGMLSAKEQIAVRDLSVESLLAFHYFTAARIDGRDYPVQSITDFSAELNNGKLTYEFLVPCRVKALAGRSQEVKVAVYDDSFYTFVSYVEEGKSAIDPSKDPLFANRQAPARPEDFKRFSDAVGLGKYKGKIPIQGDAAKFKIAADVREAPEMAYFFDQIVPQAFILDFRLK
ncbi:MAG: DUF1007 family protein [Desulfobacteraceae bacterium]